jgi:ABC-2 type transport system permease protein
MRLVRVELSRFFSRRAVALLLLAAAALIALVAVTTLWNTRPVSDAELASARAQVQQQVESPHFQRDLDQCKDDPQQLFGPGARAADCVQQLTPTTESYLGRMPLSLAQERSGGGVAVVVLVTAVMIVVGTTYAGADWSTGAVSNQVLFEPRRGHLWAAKAVAVVLGCAVAAAVLMVGFWVGLHLVAQSRGIPTGADVEEGIRWMVARGVAVAAAGGLGGFALTMLLRNTVGTLALLFAYVAGGEAVLALAPVPRPGLWSPGNNVFAWVRNGLTVYDDSIACRPDQPVCARTYVLSLTHASVYLGVLLVVTLLASAVLFRRRDIP